MSAIIIKIHGDRIYFNERLSVGAGSTNLPTDAIDFSKIKNVYWLVEQQKFDNSTGKLTLRVVDYFLREIAGFAGQNPKSAIKRLFFSDLPEVKDLKLSLRYQSGHMGRLDEALEEGYREIATGLKNPGSVQKKNVLFRSYPEQDEMVMNFDVWFKDAFFKLGYVVFERNIPKLKQLARFKIKNDFLLPEFGLIKSYFMKALGTRKFDVKATVIIEDGKIAETRASSSVIGRINENLIESIKYERTMGLLKPSLKFDIDKSLFTSDDIFDQFGEEEGRGNVFSQSEEEILRYILEKTNVRNRKQLEYLSGIKLAEGTKLRFTLHPYFGFVFATEGAKMVHFIWELLNSHATYIWSLDKGEEEIRRQYRRIEDAINQVRNSGRETYKQAYRDSHIDQDLVFNVIHHQDANSTFLEGFVRWKHLLEELLV